VKSAKDMGDREDEDDVDEKASREYEKDNNQKATKVRRRMFSNFPSNTRRQDKKDYLYFLANVFKGTFIPALPPLRIQKEGSLQKKSKIDK
jgi:hypothetical protein